MVPTTADLLESSSPRVLGSVLVLSQQNRKIVAASKGSIQVLPDTTDTLDVTPCPYVRVHFLAKPWERNSFFSSNP